MTGWIIGKDARGNTTYTADFTWFEKFMVYYGGDIIFHPVMLSVYLIFILMLCSTYFT